MALRKNKEENNYWISYSDLMTGFLIVFIILTFIVYKNYKHKTKEIEVWYNEYKKIEEIKKSIKYIDPKLFEYNLKYKKHILNLDVQFKRESSDINDISIQKLNQLKKAGKRIKTLIQDSLPQKLNIKYLIIIEGQASKDSYKDNDVLSYKRALSLKQLWIDNGIDFSKMENCELIIAGSGIGGVPRVKPDNSKKNQRFLIQIIPKVGEIENNLFE